MKIGEYVSRKDYLKKYDSNVGYALYVQDNIKKDDYAKLNIGNIVKVIGIKENNVNKKAIYYGIYDDDWFDSSAVENFSADIIDLIETDDIVILEYYVAKYRQIMTRRFEVSKIGKMITFENAHCCFIYDLNKKKFINGRGFNVKIKSILTKEQFENISYKVGD